MATQQDHRRRADRRGGSRTQTRQRQATSTRQATYRTRYSTRSRDTATAAEWRAASTLANLLEEPVELQPEVDGEPEPEPEREMEPEPEQDHESLGGHELDLEDEELSWNLEERREEARKMHHETMRSIGL